jgi:Uma2 family endonuclease
MSSKTTESSDAVEVLLDAKPAKRLVTFEEFLASGDEASMSEWIDGEVIKMSPAAERHQEIILFLAQTLGLYVRLNKVGRILIPPFAMKLAADKRGREPDLIFITQDRVHLIKRTYLDGAADLVVEIISPESIGRDRGEKFVEYEAAGIKEYWLIDPDRESAEFYELGGDGRYRAATIEAAAVYRSKVIEGFFVRPVWFWQTPAPTLEALRELKLI